MLDLSRQDVCDYIVESLSKILSTAKISYVKWDMNRNITEIGSAALPANRQQIRQYKEIRSTIHFGDLYRLRSPFEGEDTAWEHVSADLKQVVLIYCTIRAHVLTGLTQLRFEGLSENAQYRNTETGEIYSGDFLMNVGLYLPDDRDHESRILIFEQC